MYIHVFLVTIILCVVGSQAFFNFQGHRSSQPLICRLPSKPCRLQVSIRFLNGSLDSDMSTHTCTCSHPHTCSSDWSRSSHVISRNLLSTTHNITMSMMFCHPVQPQRICGVGEEALVVSGSLTIPYDVVSFNCRCSDSTPLLLSNRTTGLDYLTHHTYVCNNHMPTCPRVNSYCATLDYDGVRYGCKCPNGQHCRVDAYVDNTHGYCRQ